MLRIESPVSGKHSWTTSTPEPCSFAVTGLSYVYKSTSQSISTSHPFKAAYFSLQLMSLLPDVTSNSSIVEKETVLAQFEYRRSGFIFEYLLKLMRIAKFSRGRN